MKKSLLLIGICSLALIGCEPPAPPVSSTGVGKATAKVTVGSDGVTNEQRNIRDRLEMENKPGVVKHLYVISPESGQALIYSTVKGKVTSSGKRLSPTAIDAVINNGSNVHNGWEISYGDHRVVTREPLQDDGTYGSSEPYIYWFDVRGVYHQHFFTGGQIIHVSDAPLALKTVVINIEAGQANNPYASTQPTSR